MLVSQLPPVRVPVPHEPGKWFDFRTPGHEAVAEAREVVAAKGRRGVKDFGAEVVKAFNEVRALEKENKDTLDRVAKLAATDPYAPENFDRSTLLGASIVGWNYCVGDSDKVIKVSPDTIAQLDERTAKWAHEHIVGMIRPPSEDSYKSPDAGGAPRA